MAIYRLPGARDNNTGYIYTKPKDDTKITHRDKVFVLATSDGLNTYFNYDAKNKNENEEDWQDKQLINNDVINDENLNDNLENEELFEERKKYSPFNYMSEKLHEMDKEINKLSDFVDNTRSTLKESISSGIKQEIISLLQ